MFDQSGNKLNVGDTVAHVAKDEVDKRFYKVKGFTKQRVRVSYYNGKYWHRTLTPETLIRILSAEEIRNAQT